MNNLDFAVFLTLFLLLFILIGTVLYLKGPPFAYLEETPSFKRREKLTKLREALQENCDYDLVELCESEAIQCIGTGNTITGVTIGLKNLTSKNLSVVLKVGTYFVSSGQHQNMVCREIRRFHLSPHDKESVSVAATCLNAGRPIPTTRDRFVGARRASDRVIKFLEAAVGLSADSMVIQAGVWALTDNYTKEQIQGRLFTTNSNGSKRPGINDYQIGKAKKILDELGISHRL